ncbi:MAG: kua-ubiquitin conjugating enzyme hybrid localization domain protein [Deltaproteobacteria bacterium]|nr:kua-ubiquitin conjugating enzyme hybrid localization domain protein [Deltaproteobacteria bacterium]
MDHAPGRPRWTAGLDRLAVLLFGVLWTTALLRFAPSLLSSGLGWPALLGAMCGYLLADFLSGSVHWLADRYFTPTTWLIGPLLIAPFREHHVDASEITRHDFFEVSGNNALVTLPAVALLLTLPLPDPTGGASIPGVIGLGLGTTAALLLTNQLHRWAHTEHPPRPIARLQRWGWILSPERHARHHAGGHDRAYCVTSGWLNPLLDGTGFFSSLEALIESFCPRRRGVS